MFILTSNCKHLNQRKEVMGRNDLFLVFGMFSGSKCLNVWDFYWGSFEVRKYIGHVILPMLARAVCNGSVDSAAPLCVQA